MLLEEILVGLARDVNLALQVSQCGYIPDGQEQAVQTLAPLSASPPARLLDLTVPPTDSSGQFKPRAHL